MDFKKFKNIVYIDSPSFNDPDSYWTDTQILTDITNYLQSNLINKGLSSIL